MKSVNQSWMPENRAPQAVAGDYTRGSAVDIWPEYVAIAGDNASAAQAQIRRAPTALAQLVEASKAGPGRVDDAAMAKTVARNAKLALPGA